MKATVAVCGARYASPGGNWVTCGKVVDATGRHSGRHQTDARGNRLPALSWLNRDQAPAGNSAAAVG